MLKTKLPSELNATLSILCLLGVHFLQVWTSGILIRHDSSDRRAKMSCEDVETLVGPFDIYSFLRHSTFRLHYFVFIMHMQLE